jgi:hypothetical protein
LSAAAIVFSRLARDRRLGEALEQDLALIEEAGGAIAALEGEVGDEGLLQGRQLATAL